MRDKNGILVGSKWANGAPGAKPETQRSAEIQNAIQRKESIENTIQLLKETGIEIDPRLKEILEQQKLKLTQEQGKELLGEGEKKAKISALVNRKKAISKVIEGYQDLGDFEVPQELTTEMEGIEAQLKTLTQKPAEERIKSLQDKKSHLEKALEGKKVMVLKRREELKTMEQALQEDTQKMEQVQKELEQAYEELHPTREGEGVGQREKESEDLNEEEEEVSLVEAEESKREKEKRERSPQEEPGPKKKKGADATSIADMDES